MAGADRCWSEAPEGAGEPPLEFRYKRTTPNNKLAIPTAPTIRRNQRPIQEEAGRRTHGGHGWRPRGAFGHAVWPQPSAWARAVIYPPILGTFPIAFTARAVAVSLPQSVCNLRLRKFGYRRPKSGQAAQRAHRQLFAKLASCWRIVCHSKERGIASSAEANRSTC